MEAPSSPDEAPIDQAVSGDVGTQEVSDKRSIRKRARNACLTCRSRKIRCDVSRKGVPCSNCTYDDSECLIQDRRRRQSRINRPVLPNTNPVESFAPEIARVNTGVSPLPENEAQYFPKLLLSSPTSDTTRDVETSMFADSTFIQPVGDTLGSALQSGRSPPSISGMWLDHSNSSLGQVLGDFSHLVDAANINRSPVSHPESWQNMDVSPAHMFARSYFGSSLESLFPEKPVSHFSPGPLPDIFNYPSPSHEAFPISAWQSLLQPGDLGNVPDDDISFLLRKGALQVPSSDVFYDIMVAYFRYVHPTIPMISERDFWKLWPTTEHGTFQIKDFSLFVLQAMLFAGCAFAKQESILHCGFQSFREARHTFYCRAKLLYDFEVEQRPLYRSYGALLLTYHAPNSNENRLNSHWLGDAINSARIAGAHQYGEATGKASSEVANLKRLWWCCIFRDRILPLGVRRPLQIGEGSLDSAAHISLCLEDFGDEIGHAKSFDSSTQTRLFRLFILACELARILTAVIPNIYPSDTVPSFNIPKAGNCRVQFARLDALETTMIGWYEKAAIQFTPPLLLEDNSDPSILFANVLYIYYSGAMISIHNRQALLLELYSDDSERKSGLVAESIRRKILQSVADTNDRLKEIIQAKLTKYLPLSLCAYILFPMLLLSFNIKSTTDKLQTALRRRQFEMYAGTMKIQRTLFNGTDYVMDLIDDLTKLIEDRGPIRPSSCEVNTPEHDSPLQSSTNDGARIESWQDLLIHEPKFYLRLVAQLDIALSKGAKPEEDQFPVPLQMANL